MGSNASGTSNLPSGSSTNLFHFGWPFLLQPAGLRLGYIVGESKLTPGVFDSTKVLIDTQAAHSVRVLWLYLLVSFPMLVGCLPFGDLDSASLLPFSGSHSASDKVKSSSLFLTTLSIGCQKTSLFI